MQRENQEKEKYNKIYHKDCSSMDELADESIDLIVSGPPYWDYFNYDAHAKGNDYMWVDVKPYENFLNDIEIWYKECLRVLKEGRYCIVNIGTVSRNGHNYPLPFHIVPILEKVGFNFCFDIIWHKISGGRSHARNIIQNPYPGYYVPNNKTEYLLVFKKGSIEFCKDKYKLYQADNKIEIDDYFKKEISNNVWHFTSTHVKSKGDHPCPFPPELPYRLISLFSLVDEVVLDPFMGIGTSARAAKMLNRKFVGYELIEKYIATANRMLDIPLKFNKKIYPIYQVVEGEQMFP